MSAWVTFRNSIESIFQPEIQEAVNFGHTVSADAKAEATGDLKKAFVDAYTVYSSTPGNFQVKIIAAVTAFLTELIGDAFTLIHKDANTNK